MKLRQNAVWRVQEFAFKSPNWHQVRIGSCHHRIYIIVSTLFLLLRFNSSISRVRKNILSSSSVHECEEEKKTKNSGFSFISRTIFAFFFVCLYRTTLFIFRGSKQNVRTMLIEREFVTVFIIVSDSRFNWLWIFRSHFTFPWPFQL